MNNSPEIRKACCLPDPKLTSNDGLTRVPFVEYDPNSEDIPCNGLYKPDAEDIDVRSVIKVISVPVPADRCAKQIAAGLCPRGSGLKAEEIKA